MSRSLSISSLQATRATAIAQDTAETLLRKLMNAAQWFALGVAGGGGSFLFSSVCLLIARAEIQVLAGFSGLEATLLTASLTFLLLAMALLIASKQQTPLFDRIAMSTGFTFTTIAITLLAIHGR